MSQIPDYDAYLERQWGLDDAERRRTFQVDTDGQARWCSDKRAALRDRIEARRRDVAQQVAELKAWQAAQDALDRDEIAWFEAQLEGYFQRLQAAGKLRYGRKSYTLPNGQAIGTHTVEAVWDVVDADALADWASQHNLVRVSVDTDWGAQVKPRLVPLVDEPGAEAIDRTTGERVPGVVLVRPAGEMFVVTTARSRRGVETEEAGEREPAGLQEDPRHATEGVVSSQPGESSTPTRPEQVRKE
jgi:hypothetical protein